MAIGVVRGTHGTTSGDVDYTLAGFGTPTAAIIMYLQIPPTNNTETHQDVIVSICVTDGTNRFCNAGFYDDRNGNSFGSHRIRSDRLYMNAEDHTSFAYGTVPTGGEFITDGVRINHNEVSGTNDGELVIVMFDNANVLVGEHSAPTSSTNEFTSASFQGDLLFLISAGTTDAVPASLSNTYMFFGCAHDNGVSVDNHSFEFLDFTATSDASCLSSNRNDSLQSRVHFTNDTRHAIDDFTPSTGNGFTMSDQGASGFATRYFFLLLDTGSDEAELVETTTPASTGNTTYGTLDPVDGVVVHQSSMATANVKDSSTVEDQCHSMGAASNGGSEACIGYGEEDGASQPNGHVWRDTGQLHNVYYPTASGFGGNQIRGSINSWTGGGLEVNYSQVDRQGKGWMLLYQNAPVVSDVVPAGLRRRRSSNPLLRR